MSVPGDPRWEWICVGTIDAPDQWIRGRCKHLNPVPEQQAAHLGGAVVAYLCTDCDTQLPAEWHRAEEAQR